MQRSPVSTPCAPSCAKAACKLHSAEDTALALADQERLASTALPPA